MWWALYAISSFHHNSAVRHSYPLLQVGIPSLRELEWFAKYHITNKRLSLDTNLGLSDSRASAPSYLDLNSTWDNSRPHHSQAPEQDLPTPTLTLTITSSPQGLQKLGLPGVLYNRTQ